MRGEPDRSEDACYGLGDLGNCLMFATVQSYLAKYWIDAHHIPAGTVALVLALTTAAGALTDMGAAAWIDARRPGPRGKFRPTMLVGGQALAVATVLDFAMPHGAPAMRVAWAVAANAVWVALYSLTNNPYGSLASAMTRGVAARARLATARQVGSLVGTLVVGVAFVPMLLRLGGTPGAWTLCALAMAAAGAAAIAACYRGCRERVPPGRRARRASARLYARSVLRNRPLAALVLMNLFAISATTVGAQMLVFFAQYDLGDISLQPRINLAMIGTSGAVCLLVPAMVRRVDKKRLAVAGCLVGAAADVANFFAPTRPGAFLALATLGYVGLAVPSTIVWAFASDTIDYTRWHTGLRTETTTYAAFNASRKVAQALAALVGAGMLQVTGYVPGATRQSGATLTGLKTAMTLYPGVCLALAAGAIGLVYDLSDRRYQRIAADLGAGRLERGRTAGTPVR